MTPKTAKTENSGTCLTVEHISPWKLKPSPENEVFYRRITRDDPGVKRLAEDIQKNGRVLNPLIISKDGFIISGHRRREAAIMAGLKTVPIIRDEVERGGDECDTASTEFVRLLVSHNTQRVKTAAEEIHEAMIQIDSDEAYQELEDYRWKKSKVSSETIQVERRGRRKKISKEKREMADAAKMIVESLRDYWPLSDRGIHYQLLNDPPLRNTKTKTRYRNDKTSYKDLCNILTRMRLVYEIPMCAIEDSTRPTTEWNAYPNIQTYVESQAKKFLKDYWRDPLQSQYLYIEVIGEKLTVQNILRPICAKYCIPLTITRGYPSLPARDDIVERFKKSGKDKLLLLILSDFDPEGVSIGETLLQSMREDFYVHNAEAVRAGLNEEHIERFGLPDNFEAKKSSARYKKFVKKYGKKVHELEALLPSQLQEILEEAIQNVIDQDAFDAEKAKEKTEDAPALKAMRDHVVNELKDFQFEDEDKE